MKIPQQARLPNKSGEPARTTKARTSVLYKQGYWSVIHKGDDWKIRMLTLQLTAK